MRMFRYVAKAYLKNFLIIAFALAFLFAGLDYLQNASKLEGFNIQILYLFYKALYAFDLLFPLALVFAMIWTKVQLIRSNALVSFYALGYGKRRVLLPFVTVAAILTAGYVALHLTSFVHVEEEAKRLLERKHHRQITQNLFLKYNGSFVYIGRLIPENRLARKIRIYRFEQNGSMRIVRGEVARFDGKAWTIPVAEIVKKPKIEGLGGAGLQRSREREYRTLEGFKPGILSSVFEGKSHYSIPAAVESIKLLSAQGLDTDSIRTLLYHMTVTPLFALCLVIIFFIVIPPHARSANLLAITFLLTGITLFTWGILYLLYRVSRNGVVSPEWGSLAVIALLAATALYYLSVRPDKI